MDEDENVYAYDFEKDMGVELAKIPEHDKDIRYTFKANNMYHSVFIHNRKEIKIIINPMKVHIKESNERKTVTVKGVEFDLNVLQQRTEYFKESPSNPDKPFIYGYHNDNKNKLDFYSKYHLTYYKYYITHGVILRDCVFSLFSMCMYFGDINNNFTCVKLMRELERKNKSDVIKNIFQNPITLMDIFINLYVFYEDLLPRYVKILLKNVNIDDLLPHMKSYTPDMLHYFECSKFSRNENFQRLYKVAHDELVKR